MSQFLVREMAVESARWDAQTQAMVPQANLITVRLLLQTESEGGAWFFKDCLSPQDLWNFLMALVLDEAQTLNNEFGYRPAVRQVASKPLEPSKGKGISLADLDLNF